MSVSVPPQSTRQLLEEIQRLRHDVDTLTRNQNVAQLGLSSIDGGTLVLKDHSGVIRGGLGAQDDGTYGFVAHNGPAPPRPNTPTLEAVPGGLRVGWNGSFTAPLPHNFTYVTVHVSGAGPDFIPGDSNRVGNLLGAGTLPVQGLATGDAAAAFWAVLVAHNTSGKVSDPSLVVGPVKPSSYVADGVRAGIVDRLALAEKAVGQINIDNGAVGTTQIADGSITSPLIQAAQLVAAHFTANSVQAGTVDAAAITGREIAALSLVAQHFTAGSVQADSIAAGAVTADKLSALLVLANLIIAGDPDGWRTQIGDPTTPLLYWDGTNTGFALSRDETTGNSNIFLDGRIAFGPGGSQLEGDHIDLAQQQSTGFATPKLRQSRTAIYSEPTATPAAKGVPWLSATGNGNLLLMAVLGANLSSDGPPSFTVPASWTLVTSVVGGASGSTRLSVYYLPAAPGSHTTEKISATKNCAWAVQLIEYTGISPSSPLDVVASASGNSAVASTGTTAQTGQPNELQLAFFGTPGAGTAKGSGFSAPTNGFTIVQQGGGYNGQGLACASRLAVATGTVSSSAKVASPPEPWMGVAVTFAAASAIGIPPAPDTGILRLYTQQRVLAGTQVAVPFALDETGRTYPVGRGPSCTVVMSADFTLTANTDVYAQSGWSISDDPWGIVAIASSSGTFSNISIPLDGRYLINFRTIFANSTNTTDTLVAYVTRNARARGNTVAVDARRCINLGADGSPVQALNEMNLVAGDVLYWANWSSVNVGVVAAKLGMRTEMNLTYLGPSL